METLVPSKTIYVSDEDLSWFERAQDLSGGNLSAAISAAIHRYVEVAEGRQDGYDEITLNVGPGAGRKVRFSGVLLGEWGRTTSTRVEIFRVYRSRKGKFVVHLEQSAEWKPGPDPAKWSTGWRSWVGNWSASETWASAVGEATLSVADSLAELRDLVPPEIYDLIAAAAEHPTVQDLDI